MIGIVTLENVIERILLTDIHDEKDRDVAKKFLRKATVMYRSPSQFPSGEMDDLDKSSHSGVSGVRKVSNLLATDDTGFKASDGGEVFKSKFVKEYYNNLLEDIQRTLSRNDRLESMFSPGLRKDAVPDFGSPGHEIQIQFENSESGVAKTSTTSPLPKKSFGI